MRVILESTTQTTTLLPADGKGEGVPARIWQGFTDELDRDALVTELRALAAMLTADDRGPGVDRATCRAVHERLTNAATLVERPGAIEVHAFITRIAHKQGEPASVHERFRSELQAHAAPRPEYSVYSLRMFI